MTLKKKNLKLCLLMVAIVVTFPATAFAQGTSDTTVTTPLWVSLVAILVGYLTHAWNTGTLFGKKTLPKPYIPSVGALAAFGTAFLATLPQGATITKAVLEAAALAGLGRSRQGSIGRGSAFRTGTAGRCAKLSRADREGRRRAGRHW